MTTLSRSTRASLPSPARRQFLTLRPPPSARAGRWIHVSRAAMACRFEITVAAEHEGAVDRARGALDLVDALEAQLSVFRHDSAVSHVNRRAAQAPVPLTRAVFAVLYHAARLAAFTGGVFDPTAGPLVRCWGFLRRQGRLPRPEELSAAMSGTGIGHLRFDRPSRTIAFARPGVEMNLGAIGKGYALDRAARWLRRGGTPGALLSAGGSSVRALRRPPGGGTWTVGLRDPRRPDHRWALLHLYDAALGTSGTSEQYFVHEGRRYGHIVDPRTGWPVTGRLATTVVASTATEADALATACFVGGRPAADRCISARRDLLVILHEEGAERPVVLGQHPRCRLEPLETL